MMRKTKVLGAMIMFVMVFNSLARAGVSELVNPSFEDDRDISDITTEEPNGWDVDLPADIFGGWAAAGSSAIK